MNSVTEGCPIWSTPVENFPTRRDGYIIESPRAGGRFFISRSAEINLRDADTKQKIRLTDWIIKQHQLGVECPEITTYSLEDILNNRLLTPEERADRLLRYLNIKSERLGQIVKFYPEANLSSERVVHELFAWTSSLILSEVITLAKYCKERNWVEFSISAPGHSQDNKSYKITLKPTGYSRLAELDGINPDSAQAFVAMWFHSSMNDVYKDGIAEGIRDAGYEPLRVDRKQYNNKVDDEIIAEIRRSRFVVADFTADYDLSGADIEKPDKKGARGGVYYEAGFAHGLNIPVIFTCCSDVIDYTHFDTRQYNHIAWKTLEELRTRLSQRISATIGDGPLKKE